MRKERQIKKEMIEKYHKTINLIIDEIKRNNGFLGASVVKEIISTSKVSTSLVVYMIATGILKRVELGKYQVLIDKVEPIHVRRCIQHGRKRIKEFRRTENKVKLVENTIEKKTSENVKSKKSLSIFWGLFKIEY